jgi:enediyne biosynthesis protein E4
LKTYHLLIFLLLFIVSCSNDKATLFTLTDPDQTGIHFSNDLEYTEEFNTYTYRNFYNGGGVALGDINNDGLIDIFFTGNMRDNALYINKGNWVFEDITESAGVACADVWSTGVTMTDINGDGLMDIYVCKAGKPGGDNRHNELFINQGDLTFKESAAEYGLDITGLSIHAVFFDYDLDGDLDCYILNNSLRSVGGFDLQQDQRNLPDAEGNKLMQNDNGKFIDVTTEAGIYSSKIGYGLGVTLSDFNDDGYPDIFISNDFFEKDYLYINLQNGTFKEAGEDAFTSMSMGSMGADACDLDNDLLPDLFVTEMLPRDHERKKTKNVYETWDRYSSSVEKGYFHQYSRNALHRNLGETKFAEISRFAGVADTDWSWASLAQDYDNDGLKDLFVSNGIYKDLLDKDYLNYSANATMIRSKIEKKEKVLTMLVDSMPSVPVTNCMFKNTGKMKFEMVSDQWGLGQPGFSNGSAYGDLDNDGDLDLVVNNVNMPAFIYRNNLDTSAFKSIRFRLIGDGLNTGAIGAKVIIKYAGGQAMIENYPARGYQSTVDPTIHFGVGAVSVVDSVFVYWPDKSYSILTGLKTNQSYDIRQSDTTKEMRPETVVSAKNICTDQIIQFSHTDTEVNLFTRDRLLIEMNGFTGPALAVADVNGDGIEDIFCGGGRNQSDILFLSAGDGIFRQITAPFAANSRSESVKAVFFDSDMDGDLDLYVAHGGATFSEVAAELHDNLYINDGKGNFAIHTVPLPFQYAINTGDIAIADLNRDGLPDIVVAEHMKQAVFGLPGSIYLLYNQGDNVFNISAPDAVRNMGMMTAVEVLDMDGDGFPEIIAAGKWMPLTVIKNDKGSFDHAAPTRIMGTSGLWNTLYKMDIDNDGDEDLIAGNQGKNSFYYEGMRMCVQDFDGNGSTEQIVCYEIGNKIFPVHDPDEMYSQMPSIKKKFSRYSDFAKATMKDLFSDQKLNSALQWKIEMLQSAAFINDNGQFRIVDLPNEIQYSTVHSIFAKREKEAYRLYFGGNFYKVKPQFGRQDASPVWELVVKETRNVSEFAKPRPLFIKGQVRHIGVLNKDLVFGMNNANLVICKTNQ